MQEWPAPNQGPRRTRSSLSASAASTDTTASGRRSTDASLSAVLMGCAAHHVDIERTTSEIRRVSKTGAIFMINEIHSHSIIKKIRRCALERFIYPRMRTMIYGPGKPYITADERKLNESDIRKITKHLGRVEFARYFNCIVTRLIPDRYVFTAKLDQLLLRALRPLAPLLAGRLLFSARVQK